MLTRLKSTFHFIIANYHLRVGRFREAVTGLSEAIRLSPNYAAAYVNRGVAFQGMNDDRCAINDFDRAIAKVSLGSRRGLAFGNRGISWKILGTSTVPPPITAKRSRSPRDFRLGTKNSASSPTRSMISMPHGRMRDKSQFGNFST